MQRGGRCGSSGAGRCTSSKPGPLPCFPLLPSVRAPGPPSHALPWPCGWWLLLYAGSRCTARSSTSLPVLSAALRGIQYPVVGVPALVTAPCLSGTAPFGPGALLGYLSPSPGAARFSLVTCVSGEASHRHLLGQQSQVGVLLVCCQRPPCVPHAPQKTASGELWGGGAVWSTSPPRPSW